MSPENLFVTELLLFVATFYLNHRFERIGDSWHTARTLSLAGLTYVNYLQHDNFFFFIYAVLLVAIVVYND